MKSFSRIRSYIIASVYEIIALTHDISTSKRLLSVMLNSVFRFSPSFCVVPMFIFTFFCNPASTLPQKTTDSSGMTSSLEAEHSIVA